MYEEIVREGDVYRRAYKDGIDAYIKRLEREAFAKREAFMPQKGFAERIEEYRARYIEMLGLDRIGDEGVPAPTLTRVGEDADAELYRATVHITPEIPMQALFFLPHGVKNAPLAVAQHGGGGTPELCSDMNGQNNYNRMVRRLLARGAAVVAPQLLLWNQKEPLPTQPRHDVPYNRALTDKDLKRFGMSITGLEVKGIMDLITFLSSHPAVDGERVCMVGLSYGGYFTLHTMAADVRIKAGYALACFNDRNEYPWQDFTYHNSASTFHDAEVAALCAGRRLRIAVGKEDPVFDFRGAVLEAERVKKYFAACGCPERFTFDLWEGGHTVPDAEEGFDFLFSALKGEE